MSEIIANLLNEVDALNLANLLEKPDLLNEVNTARDKLGKNILHLLTDDQNVEMLRIILGKVDERLINMKSASGQTPLCFGLMAKPTSEEFFLELISHPSCDITIGDKRHLTPLHYAVFHGQTRIAQRLLEDGANIDAKSITGITPLYLAVENNDHEMVCMLMYYNADVNIECEKNNSWSRDITSPILHSIDREFFDITRLLLDYVADVDEPYSDGLTMLFHALLNASEITYLLIEKGANINHMYQYDHCIMAVIEISGQVTKHEFFDRLWPMVDVKFMMKYCAENLFDLCFIHNLLSDDFFASIFMDYDVEDTRSFAKRFLVHRKCTQCEALNLVCQKKRSPDSLLSLFSAALMACDQVEWDLICTITDFLGFGALFWMLVHINVEVMHYSSAYPYSPRIALFVFDKTHDHDFSIGFWKHHFARYPNREFFLPCSRDLIPFPSLKELARTTVRQSCRHPTDNSRFFAFVSRIKSMRLHKLCEDILLLRLPIYHFE